MTLVAWLKNFCQATTKPRARDFVAGGLGFGSHLIFAEKVRHQNEGSLRFDINIVEVFFKKLGLFFRSDCFIGFLMITLSKL